MLSAVVLNEKMLTPEENILASQFERGTGQRDSGHFDRNANRSRGPISPPSTDTGETTSLVATQFGDIWEEYIDPTTKEKIYRLIDKAQ